MVQVLVSYTTGETLATEVTHLAGDMWAVTFMGETVGTVTYCDSSCTWAASYHSLKPTKFPTRGAAVAHVVHNVIRNPRTWVKHRLSTPVLASA